MNRFVLPLAVLTLATVVWADSTPPLLPGEKVERFHKNQKLVKALVEHGLDLAKQDDPIQRAKQCGSVAEFFAAEIREAAKRRDGYRAAELSALLGTLLKTGVADNLRSLGPNVAPESQGMQEMLKIRKQVDKLTRPLEDPIVWLKDGPLTAPMEEAQSAIRAAREEVERVVPAAKPVAEKGL
jgi:hypothetical protein